MWPRKQYGLRGGGAAFYPKVVLEPLYYFEFGAKQEVTFFMSFAQIRSFEILSCFFVKSAGSLVGCE